MTTLEMSELTLDAAVQPRRWRPGRYQGARCAFIRLPGGITFAVVPLRTIAAPHRRLWDLRTFSEANPCDDRAFRCMSRAAVRKAIDEELYRLGLPA